MNDTAKNCFRLLALFLVLWLVAFLLLGCGVTSRLSTAAKSAPSFLFRSPSAPSGTAPTVQQSGLAATPATVATGNTVTEIPLPPGASITINAPTPDPFNPPAPGGPVPVVRVTDHRESVTTPTAYAPPAPPSAREQANADAITRSYYFAAALALAAALLFWRGHLKAALIALAGAIACPLVTNFIGSEWGQRAALVAGAVALSLFAAWHFLRDQHPETIK